MADGTGLDGTGWDSTGSDGAGSDARRALRERLAAAEDRIARQRAVVEGIVASVRGENVDDEHDPEGATLAWERQQAAALLAEAETERDEVRAALDRLDAGTYGRCEVCGRVIPAGRLAARPAATRCVEHAR